MHYEQYYVKYKGLNRRYINYGFISFLDLELSFRFELRYFKTVFCKMYLKEGDQKSDFGKICGF